MTDKILKLSAKKQSGRASDEELQQLDALLAQDPDAAAILNTLFESRPDEDAASQQDSQRLWQKTLNKINQGK